MTGCYKAAFLIPTSAKRTLDDTGWLFETNDRLSPKVLDVLKHAFLLTPKETYDGIAVFVGNGIKISVIYDDAELIEHISIQLFEVTKEELESALSEERFDDVELFVP